MPRRIRKFTLQWLEIGQKLLWKYKESHNFGFFPWSALNIFAIIHYFGCDIGVNTSKNIGHDQFSLKTETIALHIGSILKTINVNTTAMSDAWLLTLLVWKCLDQKQAQLSIMHRQRSYIQRVGSLQMSGPLDLKVYISNIYR